MRWNFEKLDDEELLMYFVSLNELKDEMDEWLFNSLNDAVKEEIKKRNGNKTIKLMESDAE